MAVRPILKMGHPVLLQVAQPIPPETIRSREIQDLISDMFETMWAADGVGLAAPQIGVSLQLVIFGFDENPRYPEVDPVPKTILINPVIESLSDEQEDGWEGCLSVPGLRGRVPRYTHIRYRGVNEKGEPIDREATGFHARVVQHECDHLLGKLYPMRMTDLTQLGFIDALPPPNPDELVDD